MTPEPGVPAPPARPRLLYLDGLRALAALYVVGFHVLGFTGERLSGPWRVARRLFAFGHEAVAIFIVLSGYCLMLPVAKSGQPRLTSGLGSFLWRRAIRILPPYYLALGLSLLLLALVPALRQGGAGTIWDNSLPGLELRAVLAHVALVHNFMPTLAFQINGPHWSVASEWQIYFCFPLLLLPCWRHWGPLVTLGAALALGYAPLAFAPEAAITACPWYLALFMLGMLAAWVSVGPAPARAKSVPWSRLSMLAWAACVTGGMLAAGIWFRFKPATDLLMGLAAACSLVALTERASGERARSAVLGWLEHPLLVAVGHFSYSLYLTHLPVLALCWLALAPWIAAPGPLTLALLGLGGLASLALAYAFFVAFERPFLSLRAARPVQSVA